MEESTSERERVREQESKRAREKAREKEYKRERAPATATHYREAELCARSIDWVYMENTWKYVRNGQSHQPWLGGQCMTFSWSLRSRGWEMATPHGLVVVVEENQGIL